MAAKKKKGSSGKTFRFQLSLGGIVGIAVVSFCLFLWMFLLGVWAGQTILLPAARTPAAKSATAGSTPERSGMPVKSLSSGAKSRPGSTAQKQ